MGLADTLADIRRKLRESAYQNEEHVRFSLVGRVLADLEWDIWNPQEVYPEFKPVPSEDSTKVDVALFLTPTEPSVFIEVKAVGRIGDLAEVERQVRDYNRNYSALFCVITDGAVWRLYYPRTGGEFSRKRFKVLNLDKDELREVEAGLQAFLRKDEIRTGRAETEAKALLELTDAERVMEECLPRARRATQEPPYPTLPEGLHELVTGQKPQITREAVVRFLESRPARGPDSSGRDRVSRDEGGAEQHPEDIVLNPERPESLRFTRVIEASIGSKTCRAWNDLVRTGFRLAVERGHGIGELREWVKGNIIREGRLTTDGFHPIPGTGLSVVGMEAHRAWENAFILAKRLACEVLVRFRWEEHEGAAHPGRQGVLRWVP